MKKLILFLIGAFVLSSCASIFTGSKRSVLFESNPSGAIEIYKRTGSLSKLQKALGHSSLAVSLTYLRGLEVSELEESDMPMV